MPKPVSVQPKDSYTIYLKYDDGTDGSINLLKTIERNNYKELMDPSEFATAALDTETNDITWQCGITMCKDALYRQLELKNLMKRLKIDIDKNDN